MPPRTAVACHCSPLRFDLAWRLDAGEKQTEVVAVQRQPLVGLAQRPVIPEVLWGARAALEALDIKTRDSG